MAKTCGVRTEHIGNELLLVDFDGFAILSDHPERMGGTGRGPMPGELLKGALAASAVLAAADAARAEGISIDRIKVACGSETTTERREDGPLPSLTVLTGFTLAIAAGDLTEPQAQRLEAAARSCPVAGVLTGEVAMIERNDFRATEIGRDARSTTFLIDSMKAHRPAAGETVVRKAEEVSQVTAEDIGEGRVLLRWGRSSFVAGRAGVPGAVTPEELVLAALCACTSVFSARSGAMVDAGLEIRVACAGDFDASPVRMEKAVEFAGTFDAAQREVLAYCADNCAIGETLRRKARLQVVVERAGLDVPGVVCDDGACCVAGHTAQA